MADAAALASALAGANIVVHLASGSLPHSSNLDPRGDVQANLLGALNVLEAARLAGVGRVLVLV